MILFFIFFCWGLLEDLEHHLSIIFNAIDISSFARHMQHRCHKVSGDHSPWLPCQCLAGQLPLHTTRVRSWTPLSCRERIMSREECSYNEGLYCSSAIGSVHHTDKRLSMNCVRRISIGLCDGFLRFGRAVFGLLSEQPAS